MANIPQHVAIIPDGNRRWAQDQGKEAWEGHEKGAKNIELIVKKAHEMGVEQLSFWGSSLENISKRPLQERKALFDIYERYFKKLIESDEIDKNQTRINVIGRWEEQFPKKLKELLKKGIKHTQKYERHTLNFFLAYSGDDDMLLAMKKIVGKYEHAKDVTKEVIKEHLMTYELPSVDYLIRTGGEPHLSAGFLMWDTANAQLYFSKKFFPDFNAKEFEDAIIEYGQRDIRLGK